MLKDKVLHRDCHLKSTSYLLEIPYVRYKTFALRSFSVAGPRLWNGLPKNLREFKDFGRFRK